MSKTILTAVILGWGLTNICLAIDSSGYGYTGAGFVGGPGHANGLRFGGNSYAAYGNYGPTQVLTSDNGSEGGEAIEGDVGPGYSGCGAGGCGGGGCAGGNCGGCANGMCLDWQLTGWFAPTETHGWGGHGCRGCR